MDVTNIMEIIISLVSAIITAFVIPLLVKKFGEQKVNNVKYWVRVAVAAAEQVYKVTAKSGAEKKNYVLEFLSKSGITYDVDKINALIESTVLELADETKSKED